MEREGGKEMERENLNTLRYALASFEDGEIRGLSVSRLEIPREEESDWF